MLDINLGRGEQDSALGQTHIYPALLDGAVGARDTLADRPGVTRPARWLVRAAFRRVRIGGRGRLRGSPSRDVIRAARGLGLIRAQDDHGV